MRSDMSSFSQGLSATLKGNITSYTHDAHHQSLLPPQTKYVPRHLVRRRDALSQAVSVLTSTGIDGGVSRSGCLMSMVGPPADVTDIFAHVVAAIVRRNSPRVVETFAHACAHLIFSISHCAAPVTVRCQSKPSDEIGIGQIIWNTSYGVQPP